MEVTLEEIAKKLRLEVLGLYHSAHAGHIGSSLSCIDILVACYFGAMRKEDQFVLSKGHAAAALYVTLAHQGVLDVSLLKTFYQDGTKLPAHVPSDLPGVPFATGSLGHGLPLATGLALSAKLKQSKERIFCLLSDGDLNEGSTFEAMLFAQQHRLHQLIVIIDWNELQGFGRTKDVLDMEPLQEKLEAFRFKTATVDGHDIGNILYMIKKLQENNTTQPIAILAKTIKGKGVSYMENKMSWHYWPMDEKQYQQACTELQN